MTHQHAARTLGSSVDPDDLEEIDSGSDDEESATGIGIVEEAASAIHSQVLYVCSYESVHGIVHVLSICVVLMVLFVVNMC